MNHSLFALVSLILLFIGLIGTFLPILPGLVLSFSGLLLYKFGTNSDLSIIYIWLFGTLTIASIFLNYFIPAKTTKKYGGTRWGSIGSVLGTILGVFFIPIPFGFLIGMFFGVFIGELLHNKNDINKALQSVKGSFIGFLIGTGFSFVIGFAMLFVVLVDYFF